MITFQIMIKIERGKTYRSDIAIDDVSFAPECLQIKSRLFIYSSRILMML